MFEDVCVGSLFGDVCLKVFGDVCVGVCRGCECCRVFEDVSVAGCSKMCVLEDV